MPVHQLMNICSHMKALAVAEMGSVFCCSSRSSERGRGMEVQGRTGDYTGLRKAKMYCGFKNRF